MSATVNVALTSINQVPSPDQVRTAISFAHRLSARVEKPIKLFYTDERDRIPKIAGVHMLDQFDQTKLVKSASFRATEFECSMIMLQKDYTSIEARPGNKVRVDLSALAEDAIFSTLITGAGVVAFVARDGTYFFVSSLDDLLPSLSLYSRDVLVREREKLRIAHT